MEVDEVLTTEEQVAARFASGCPAAAYRGEWLCFEAGFKAKGGIVFLEQAIGKAVDRSVLQGWKGAAKGSRRQRMTNLNSQDGLLVNDVLIFKAEPGECYGEKAKYIAFGERPSECVAVQMKERLKHEKGTGSVGNGNEMEMRPASSSSSSSSSSSPSAPFSSPLPPSKSVGTSEHKKYKTATTKPMEEDYVTFTPDMTEHDEDELMEDAARGGERLTRATVPPPKADVAKAPQPRDSSTGKYKSVAVALEDTLGALVELAAEHRVKLGELAVAQSALKKHEQRAARRDASNLKQLQEQKDKVVSVQAKADKNTAAAAATHEKERKRLQGDLNKAMRAAAAAEAAKEGAELRAGREATLRVQAERRQESAEKAVEKEKEKRVAEVGKASAAVERFRVLKNQANERARAATKKAGKMESLLGRKVAMVEVLQERLAAEQHDNMELAVENEDQAEEVRELAKTVAELEALLDKDSKQQYDCLRASREGAEEPSISLMRELGVRGERYSQDVVELGLELMSQALTAQQAVSVVRTFVAFEHPTKVEGEDYRVPSAQRFREWRMMIEPIAHYMSVSLITLSDHYHLAHDASTKGKLMHIYQTAVTCVLKDAETNEEEVVVVPLKFEVCPSGTAEAEAKLTSDALHCSAGRGQHATLLTAVSACSDHAALGTTGAIEELKQKELEAAAAAAVAGLEANPERARPAVEAWKKMTPSERESAKKLHQLGCTSHALNLTTEASHNKTEMKAIEENMVRFRAALIITRFFYRNQYRETVAQARSEVVLTEAVVLEKYGDVYGGKIMAWLSRDSTMVVAASPVPRAPAWRYRALFKGYSITPMNKRKADTMAMLGHDASKGTTGGHFSGVPFSAKAMELRPAHKHLDGTSDLPDPSAFLRGAAMLFSESGEQGSYYLVEWRELVEWQVEENKALPEDEQLELVPVPAIKGSRQSITVMLASAALRNRRCWLRYLHKIRADQSHNELVKKTYYSLQDPFMLSAIASRAVVDVTMTQPMTPFSRSSKIGRKDVYGIMTCVRSHIDGFGNLEQDAPPPPLQRLATSIIDEIPRLKPEVYDKWWADRKEDLEATYALATDGEYWVMASEHLRLASIPMRKTHDDNLSKDCSDLEELRHACVTTDHVESGFGAIDYVSHHTSASMRAVIGVAHANRIHLMQSKGEMEARARKLLAKEHRVVGGKASDEDVGALVKKWEYTSFKRLSREERWELLTDVQRRSAELRGEWKKKVKSHDAARLKRKVDSQEADINTAQNKALKFQQYDQVVPITTMEALDGLRSKYAGKGKDKEYAEHLRDQLRSRQHCYEWKKSSLPNFGSSHNDAELKRLESALRSVVVKDIGEKKAPPLARLLRPAPPTMTAEATQLQMEHLKLVSQATFEIMKLARSGVFSMKPRDREGASKRTSRPRRTKKNVAKKARRVTDEEKGLVGEAFEEEAIEWMVLDVLWSDDDSEVVVHYYDIADAYNEGLTEDDLREALEDNEYYDCMERSKVSEIRKWIKEGSTSPSISLNDRMDERGECGD